MKSIILEYITEEVPEYKEYDVHYKKDGKSFIETVKAKSDQEAVDFIINKYNVNWIVSCTDF